MDNTFLSYACDILADTNNGLTGSEIIKYCNKFALNFNVIIPVNDIEMLKTTYKKPISNKRTALKMNLEVFDSKQQEEIIIFLCNLPKFKDKCDIKELQNKMAIRFNSKKNEELDKKITETKHWLGNYPNSLKVYNEAIQKYEHGIYQRNILDDMRLSLELLLKSILNNEKSLENQIKIVREEFKNRNVSKEITNIFDKLLVYYSDYQNHYIKHNDKVKPEEIDFITNQTNTIMMFLIKLWNN